MTFATDLYRRSQTRRKLAFEYLAWANQDVTDRKMDRAMENYGHFHSLMQMAREDLYHLRVWGYYSKPRAVYLEAAQ